ncbi:TonB-dependent hemoglobin/transferrin/lactoferrin family receptor [Thiopseudomonas alkaliphila]|uniref:TonB-dependent hemoglobin/transferrin/lactoferrin family receptor n=1 Tax=Thiopseudomonas alkaliphila TaxID=1697053 RepID=UPI0025788CD6|nr:TonB-dependent hemoglobin/transferrin/lactoferrin family receptor [Thiopseudomonas alkaliphila]MDM1707235.1 TonB-dependent hemoglobin/transferrin/lactoferrin family receptor [Thiopseudomonas alkaliphila]
MRLFSAFAVQPLWIALCLNPSLVHAESPKNATRLNAVTVSATRSEQKISEVPSVVSVHTEQEIDQQNIKNIQDLIRYEPGLSVGGTNSRFGLSGINIRGMGGNRVLTQMDGVSVADSFSFGGFLTAQRDYIDLDTVKQVEIIRGPASSLYGSDALGGAVSFVSKDARDYLADGKNHFFRLKTGYDGSDDSWLRSATLAGQSGDLDALVHIGRRSGQATDSHSKTGGIGNARGKSNPQEYTRDNLLAKLGWQLNAQQRLQFTYDRFAQDTDTNVLTNYSLTAATRTQQAKDTTERQRFSLQHEWQLDQPWIDRLTTQLSQQTSDTRQKTYEDRVSRGVASFRSRDSKYQEKLWVLNSLAQTEFAWGATAHQLSYGLEIKRNKNRDARLGQETLLSTGISKPMLPVSDFPDPTTSEYALFAQDRIQWGQWTFLPGLRYDYYKMQPHATKRYLNSQAQDANPSTFTDSMLSPKLGVTYQLNPQHSLYGQYAAGYRAPQAVQIFGEFENPGMYRTLANTRLKAETSDSFELGLRANYALGNLDLAVFYNRYDDFIEQVSRPSNKPGYPFGEFQYINQDRVTIYGAEFKGELFLDEVGFSQGWLARSSLAYARGKDKKSGQPLNSVDPLKAVFGLGYEQSNGTFGGDLNWTLVAAKNRVNTEQLPSQFKTAGYGVLDLNGWWQMSEQLQINAGLYNLTNKRYWHWADMRGLSQQTGDINSARFSQPGRYAAVNLVWEM